MHQRLLIALSFALCACTSTDSEARQVRGVSLDFDGSEAMQRLNGLTGKWNRVEDLTAPSGGYAIAQENNGVSADFNVLLINEFQTSAVDLSLAFQAMSGEIDQGGGPIWRAIDKDNYYVARYNPLEHNYRVYTVKDGQRTELQSADIPSTPGWHTLRVTMAGDRIRCYYDGRLCLELNDTTFTEAGQVGMWTKADAQTHFDNFEVK